MVTAQRLSLLTLMLFLALLFVWFPNSPCLKSKTIPRPPPIEVAFDKITLGMPEDTLFSVMAPYKEEFTGHYQWRIWSESETFVAVTIIPDGGLFMPAGPWRLKEKSLLRRVSDENRSRLIPIKGTQLILVPK